MWCGVQDIEAGGGAASEEEVTDSEEDFHSQVCITNTVSGHESTAQRHIRLCTRPACPAQMACLL